MGSSESTKRAFWSATTTLTLGILGSSVLPVPFAFSRLGLLPGLGVAFVVALVNAYTGTLLLHAAGALHKRTYEGVCAAAWHSSLWRTVAQLSLISLLFGTLAGDAALLADTGTLTLVKLSGGRELPDWIVANGRAPMAALILLLVLPLSLSKKMRSLERAATAGVGLVLILAIVIVHSAVSAGLPAIENGEFPIARVAKGEGSAVPEAVSVLSFAFYLQPMLLPLLSEMPPGRTGLMLMCHALQVVTIVISFAVYAVIGIFGAARWGLATEGDVLVNEWLPGQGGGMLDAAMAVYLSISMAPMAITMRYLLDSVVAKGELAEYSRGRDAAVTIAGIASATAVAAVWPEKAEQLFAVTGASAVCLVSYILPVAVHLRLYLTHGWRGRVGLVGDSPEAWLLQDAARLEAAAVLDRRQSSVFMPESREGSDVGPGAWADEEGHVVDTLAPALLHPYPSIQDLEKMSWWRKGVAAAWYLAVPVLVLCFGLGTSISALSISLAKM